MDFTERFPPRREWGHWDSELGGHGSNTGRVTPLPAGITYVQSVIGLPRSVFHAFYGVPSPLERILLLQSHSRHAYRRLVTWGYLLRYQDTPPNVAPTGVHPWDCWT